jgi:two-component system OmpR family response regulator
MPPDIPFAPNATPRILVIDADRRMVERLRGAFSGNDLGFEQALTWPDAAIRLKSGGVDLVTLDLDLPAVDGLDVLREIQSNSRLPVIVVTARAPKVASVLCLELGADDYVVKPADADEINARIRAVLRRRRGEGSVVSGFGEAGRAFDPETVTFAGWRFDTAGLNLWTEAGNPVHVTATEASVLRCLVRNARRTVARSEINRHIHGQASACDDRSVDVLIKKLRAKIAAHAPSLHPIRSVRGVGYMFCLDVRAAA